MIRWFFSFLRPRRPAQPWLQFWLEREARRIGYQD
jgi:hypothetical protein